MNVCGATEKYIYKFYPIVKQETIANHHKIAKFQISRRKTK